MKKRLNFITMLLFFAFGLHSAHFLGEALYSFKLGFKEGYSAAENGKMKEHLFITVLPHEHGAYVDSVYNEKSNTWLPARIQTMDVVVDDFQQTETQIALRMISTFIALAIFIAIIIFFIKLIIRINKSIIFDRLNIRWLRFMGTGMVVLFLISFFVDYHSLQISRSILEIPDYNISGADIVNALSLILGIIAFLIAEVFAIGLRLKEEQELTI